MVRKMSNKILLVGGGGREDAIARKLSHAGAEIYTVMKNENPSISALSRDSFIHDELDEDGILNYAVQNGVDLAFIGPDPVLATRLVDKLAEKGIKVASPSRSAARLETSKAFMREFVERNSIPGNIEFHILTKENDLENILKESNRDYAVKPLGLTGGKGVKVMGLQLSGRDEAISYGKSILDRDGAVILEERIMGEEFSLQVFSDGEKICPFPIVQDYKRAYEGDKGPNTGGMGAISDRGGGLPFIDGKVVEEALEILDMIISGMKKENNPFRGVLYGQFMQVDGSARIVELNARFADPEGISVLTLLEDNLLDILYEVAEGRLRQKMRFRDRASVLKYIVPEGYGTKPLPSELDITLEPEDEDFSIYYAAVSGTLQNVRMSTSRALALIGLGESIPDASRKVEENLWRIKGNYAMRHDIGTQEMLEKKKIS